MLQQFVRLPMSFYCRYPDDLPSTMFLEDNFCNNYPAVIHFDNKNKPYLKTDTIAICKFHHYKNCAMNCLTYIYGGWFTMFVPESSHLLDKDDDFDIQTSDSNDDITHTEDP